MPKKQKKSYSRQSRNSKFWGEEWNGGEIAFAIVFYGGLIWTAIIFFTH